jgi:outer membrane lipoprotein-sorting protein
MRLGRLLLVLGVPFLLSACATLPILPPETRPPEEILQEVSARRRALQGLKGLAQVKVSSEGKSVKSQQVLFARRPGFLRVESLSPLGTPLLYVVTDGKTLRLYHPGENRYYQGSYRGSSPSLGLPPDLTPEEVVAFLLGGLPPGEYEKASSWADRKEGLWVLDLLSPSRGESQILWVHPEHFSILRGEFNSPRFSYRVSFGDFRQTNGILFPRNMVLTSADPPTRISVEFQELELNPPHWQDQDFLLPVPRGAEVHPLR